MCIWPAGSLSRGEQNRKHCNKINTNNAIPVAWVLPSYISHKKRISQLERDEQKSGYTEKVIIDFWSGLGFNTLIWQIWQIFTTILTVHWTIKEQVFVVFYLITLLYNSYWNHWNTLSYRVVVIKIWGANFVPFHSYCHDQNCLVLYHSYWNQWDTLTYRVIVTRIDGTNFTSCHT